jgi:hypothetical protein
MARVIFLLTEEKIFRNQPIRNKNCLWQPCLLTDRDKMSTFHRCFLPSFSSFGLGVSEEKIKMWKANERQVMAKAHIAFGKVS